jgi:trehalose 6-phosphate synthase
MNLVAKEYVAAQNANDPGVLILSRFAGAAAECRDALLVNPYDLELVADAIARALEMPLSERQERHSHILATLSQNSSDVWGARFLHALEQLEVPGSDEESLQRYVI